MGQGVGNEPGLACFSFGLPSAYHRFGKHSIRRTSEAELAVKPMMMNLTNQIIANGEKNMSNQP